ncbi:aminotransferase class IV [Streptomyces alkaliterrae]|uniref:Aminotransferase class IV n=1 Tax=Streptomyces alkaliterrae TaxID=2213162 RepID=A0A7W3WYB5_9ACTN|nr:aminotransferase class IV [Streptomyces alkaliterrae]
MRTLHIGETDGGAVLVDGDRIAAVGAAEELAAAHPEARVRRWPGRLGPGRCAADAARFLEQAYHPDPREADDLGTEPLTGAALAALNPTPTRWSESTRRGVQRLLADGVTAVVGPFTRPATETAVRRAGHDDALFVDRAGTLSEGATWNLGLVRDDQVLWPDADVLPGITMRLLADEFGHTAVRLTPADLTGVDAAFATNAVTGVRPIARIDDAPLAADHPLVARLAHHHDQLPDEAL